MDRSRIGIVIPALNEAMTIEGVVEAVGRFGMPIVVDDSSVDNTAELAKRAGAVVLSHVKNCGYDAALNTGFKEAALQGNEIVVTFDADGQHDPSMLLKFIHCINEGADVVVGIRSRQQRIAERLFSLYTKYRYGIDDPLCGMKAYRISVYKALGHFDSYGSIGTELLIYAARSGCHLAQIKFDVRERMGEPRFGRALVANYKIFRAMMFGMWGPIVTHR